MTADLGGIRALATDLSLPHCCDGRGTSSRAATTFAKKALLMCSVLASDARGVCALSIRLEMCQSAALTQSRWRWEICRCRRRSLLWRWAWGGGHEEFRARKSRAWMAPKSAWPRKSEPVGPEKGGDTTRGCWTRGRAVSGWTQ